MLPFSDCVITCTRIKWYVSINVTNPLGAARLIGVNGN